MPHWYCNVKYIAFIFILAHSMVYAEEKTNLAERLGYAKTDRLLIIHADDVGITQAVNDATIELMDEGSVSSASIIVPGPAANSAVNYAVENPNTDFGLHITMNSEYSDYQWSPMLPKNRVPSIHMGDHFFEGRIGLMLWAEDNEVEDEMRAQIDNALITGMPVSHIDTHMGAMFMTKAWFFSYLRAAKDYQIAPMVPKWSIHLEQQLGLMKHFMVDKETLQIAEQNGYLVLDYLILGVRSDKYEGRKNEYLNILKNLQPGVTQLLVHPSTSSSLKERNLLDYQILNSAEFKDALQNSNIILINWKDIQSAYDWDSVVAPE